MARVVGELMLQGNLYEKRPGHSWLQPDEHWTYHKAHLCPLVKFLMLLHKHRKDRKKKKKKNRKTGKMKRSEKQ